MGEIVLKASLIFLWNVADYLPNQRDALQIFIYAP